MRFFATTVASTNAEGRSGRPCARGARTGTNSGRWPLAVLCAGLLVLAACSGPRTRQPVEHLPAKPGRTDTTPEPSIPTVTMGETVIDQRYGQDSNEAKSALAQDNRESLPLAEVGYYMDVLHGRLKQLAGKDVGVGRQRQIIVLVLTGNNGFDPGSAQANANLRAVLNRLAKVLVEYRKTTVSVRIRGDDAGAHASNPQLAVLRRRAVADVLAATGIADKRIVLPGSVPGRAPAAKANGGIPLRVEVQLEPIVRTAGAKR